jgi:DNA (cytosine-5)-methyltransferase 1
MRIGSLFSGIGGLELGLEMAGLGETVWQVERDDYCRAVLAKHWPHVERFDDVRTVSAATLAAVDLICGGFPCQDVSSAGKRAGLDGARSGLWFEYLRIVSEIRPSWVVVENVASGAPAWVDVVRAGLGELGYASLPIPLAAADVGAPHERARVFIVAAHADAQRQPARAEHAEVAGAQAAAHADGAHVRLVRACERPQEQDARVCSAPELAGDGKGHVADAEGSGPPLSRRSSRSGAQLARPADGHWRSAMPDMVRVVHGVSRGLDRPTRRIAALGNAVVPQCAEVIGHVIQELTCC